MKLTTVSALLIASSTLTVAAFAHDGAGRDPMSRFDTNHDGVVSREESLAAADAMFVKIDANDDGVITRDEADAARAHMKEKFQQAGEERFAREDANKNGVLERSEVARMPEAMFKSIDANADGALSKDELRAAFQAKQGKHPEQGHDPFTAADANQDGQVTLEESEALAEKHFDRMDKNGDGVISKDELPQRHGHGRDEQNQS